jgi:D-alanyl-D-alanine carboxypeptidase
MTGRTWHQGCPVGRSGLRYLRINYWDYSGYRRRGELVAHASAVGKMAGALAEMYRKKLPIRSMYRVDRFGWSSRVRGGDDYRSMAAGNTSAFNCRDVVGKPGVRSPHSYGRSLDLNTWENPYRSRQGTVPNTWWMGHSHPRVAWRSRSHPVVQLMARHGLRWTYGNGDTQHFDAYGSRGRLAARYAECDGVCD